VQQTTLENFPTLKEDPYQNERKMGLMFGITFNSPRKFSYAKIKIHMTMDKSQL